MITDDVSVSGVFIVDVSTVPVESGPKATYNQISFSFFTVNDTIDLTTGAVFIKIADINAEIKFGF